MLPSLQKLRLAPERTGAPAKGDLLGKILSNMEELQKQTKASQQESAKWKQIYDKVASHLNATKMCNDALTKLLLDEEGLYRPHLSQADLESAKTKARAAMGEAEEAMRLVAAAMPVPKDWPQNVKSEVVSGPGFKAFNAATEAVRLAHETMRLVEEAAARPEFAQLVGGPQERGYKILDVARPGGFHPKRPPAPQSKKHAGVQYIQTEDRGGRYTDDDGSGEAHKDYHNEWNRDVEMEERYVLKAKDVELYTPDMMQLIRSMDATGEASVSSEESEEDGDESQEGSDESEEDGTNPALDGGSEEPSGSRSATGRASLTPDEQRLEAANMRYRQVRCWLEHLGQGGVPAGLGLWLTSDEISTIETQARRASVQWAREGSDDDHAEAGHAKASPGFWAIILALQALAVRNKSQRVEVKNASFQLGGKEYDARTFYTLTGIHEYFDKNFKSTKCEDKAPQNVANTRVRGQLGRAQHRYVDKKRTNVLRLDSLGNDQNRLKKAYTLDRLLRREAAAAEYEQTKRRPLRSSAQGAAAGGEAARETEARKAALRAFNDPANGLFDSVREFWPPKVVDGVVPDVKMERPIRLGPDDPPKKPASERPPTAPVPPDQRREWEDRKDLQKAAHAADIAHRNASRRLDNMIEHKGKDKEQTERGTPKRKEVTQPTEKEESRARRDAAKALKTEENRKATVAREAASARRNATRLAKAATEAEKVLQELRDAQARAPPKTRVALENKVRAATRAYDAESKRASAALQEAEAKEAAASMAQAGNPALDGGEE